MKTYTVLEYFMPYCTLNKKTCSQTMKKTPPHSLHNTINKRNQPFFLSNNSRLQSFYLHSLFRTGTLKKKKLRKDQTTRQTFKKENAELQRLRMQFSKTICKGYVTSIPLAGYLCSEAAIEAHPSTPSWGEWALTSQYTQHWLPTQADWEVRRSSVRPCSGKRL